MTDAQAAALALPPEGIRISMSPVIEHRYVGTKRLPPGPPPGLKRNPDGSHSLQNVAIVRVGHETEVLAAQRLYKDAVVRSVSIGVIAGIAVLTLAAAFYWVRQRAPAPPADVSSPCLVASLDAQAVTCRHGQQSLRVQPGQFFPDGRYRLTGIDPHQRSFSAVRLTDRLAVLFQHSPTTTPSMELNRK